MGVTVLKNKCELIRLTFVYIGYAENLLNAPRIYQWVHDNTILLLTDHKAAVERVVTVHITSAVYIPN